MQKNIYQNISATSVLLLPTADSLRINPRKPWWLNIALLYSTVLEDCLTVGLLDHGTNPSREPLWVTAVPLRHLCLGHRPHCEVPLHISVIILGEKWKFYLIGFSDNFFRLLHFSTVEAKLVVNTLVLGVMYLAMPQLYLTYFCFNIHTWRCPPTHTCFSSLPILNLSTLILNTPPETPWASLTMYQQIRVLSFSLSVRGGLARRTKVPGNRSTVVLRSFDIIQSTLVMV